MILPRAYSFIFSRVLVSFPFLWARKIQGAVLLRARVLVSKLFIPRLVLLVMAEIGRNCAVSAFCFFGRGRYRVGCEWL